MIAVGVVVEAVGAAWDDRALGGELELGQIADL